MKMAIIGHGFVGKAVDAGFNDPEVEKIIIDPKSLKKLLKNKNNENSFNPNQIIDLFSD